MTIVDTETFEKIKHAARNADEYMKQSRAHGISLDEKVALHRKAKAALQEARDLALKK